MVQRIGPREQRPTVKERESIREEMRLETGFEGLQRLRVPKSVWKLIPSKGALIREGTLTMRLCSHARNGKDSII